MNDDDRYLNHYGLIANPFQDLTNRRFIWLGENQLENLAHLKIGIEQTKGIMLLTGEDGSGKSILFKCLLKIIQTDTLVAILEEPAVSVSRFFAFLADNYKIDKKIDTKSDFVIGFRSFLLEMQASGKRVLLVAEDAENQSDEVIEQIRLLSNMEEEGNKLLSILLIGNAKLNDRLQQHHHRALLQRLAVKRQIEPLTEKETAAYIRHRMMVAGSFLEIFTPDAVQAINSFSGGLPNIINLICDHALMRGYQEGLRTITGRIIDTYAKSMRGTFESGGSNLRAAVMGPSKINRSRLGEKRFSNWLAAVLTLAAVLWIALGSRLVKFEPEPGALTKVMPPPPLILYFESGFTKLSENDSARLDLVAEFMTQNPMSRAAIKGYADSKGAAAQNMRISASRAEEAKTYLVRKGVDPGKIMAVGMGNIQPADTIRPVDEEKLRRRVEIEVDTDGRATR